MSLPGSTAEADQKLNSRVDAAQHETPRAADSEAIGLSMDSAIVPDFDKPLHNRQFLQAPQQWGPPHRPLSPDTLSNLSVDEFEQLRPRRSRSPRHHRSSSGTRHKFLGPAGWRNKLHAIWIRNLGLLYMLFAQVFGTLMNVTTRLLEVEGNKGKGLHPFQVLFARMSITVVLACTYMYFKKTPHFPFGMPEVRWLLVARGVGGFFGVFGMYYSLLYLPLADATVITFLAPGLSCWACSILIKEPFTRIEKIGSLISLVGVVFIARPTSLFAFSAATPPASGNSDAVPITNGTVPIPDASNYDNVTPAERLSAVGIALVGVCGAVSAYTTIRWIGKRAHPLISVNYFAMWCTIVSIVAQLTLPGVGFLLPADAKEWGYLLFLGACGFIMQFLLAAGLSYEKSSRATNMTYTQMLFALSFDRFFFGTTPSLMSIIGSTLILGSAIYMALQRQSASGEEGEEESELRRQRSRDEEVGLMSAMGDGEVELQNETGAEDVEMRRLR
ncbi:hypothetical protein MBLNU459_g7757t1 [Dothideomycetes sp. NU459]